MQTLTLEIKLDIKKYSGGEEKMLWCKAFQDDGDVVLMRKKFCGGRFIHLVLNFFQETSNAGGL